MLINVTSWKVEQPATFSGVVSYSIILSRFQRATRTSCGGKNINNVNRYTLSVTFPTAVMNIYEANVSFWIGRQRSPLRRGVNVNWISHVYVLSIPFRWDNTNLHNFLFQVYRKLLHFAYPRPYHLHIQPCRTVQQIAESIESIFSFANQQPETARMLSKENILDWEQPMIIYGRRVACCFLLSTMFFIVSTIVDFVRQENVIGKLVFVVTCFRFRSGCIFKFSFRQIALPLYTYSRLLTEMSRLLLSIMIIYL